MKTKVIALCCPECRYNKDNDAWHHVDCLIFIDKAKAKYPVRVYWDDKHRTGYGMGRQPGVY